MMLTWELGGLVGAFSSTTFKTLMVPSISQILSAFVPSMHVLTNKTLKGFLAHSSVKIL